MSLYRDTNRMEALCDVFMPYLDKHASLPIDAPEEVRKAFEEYKRLAKEQEEFALSL